MKTVKLASLCVDDEIGKYGIPASAVDFNDKLYRYLRITDISDTGDLKDDEKKSIVNKNAAKYLLSENDIVFARTGNSTGRALFYESEYGKLSYAGFLIKYKLDPKRVNPKYLKYYTISKEYKKWVKNYQDGSTRGNMNAQSFASMPIELPSRDKQDLLVSTLSLLSKKISLNNIINNKLEKIARLIYKQWFIQFDFPDENNRPLLYRLFDWWGLGSATCQK